MRSVEKLLPILLVSLIAACADVAVVDSGHRAVLLTPDGSISMIGEGVSAVPADSVIDDFDLRSQTIGGTFTAITKDAVPIRVTNPIVTFSWIADEVARADRELDQRTAPQVIQATVAAAVHRVLASYRWDELDTARIREAQAKIESTAAASLRPRHLALDSVELKGITQELPALAKEISDTSVWEERAKTAKTRIEVARGRADNLRAAAAGIAAANSKIAPTLTAGVLAEKSDQAWAALAAAPATKLEITNQDKPDVEISP